MKADGVELVNGSGELREQFRVRATVASPRTRLPGIAKRFAGLHTARSHT